MCKSWLTLLTFEHLTVISTVLYVDKTTCVESRKFQWYYKYTDLITAHFLAINNAPISKDLKMSEMKAEAVSRLYAEAAKSKNLHATKSVQEKSLYAKT